MLRRTGLILCLLIAGLFFGDALIGNRTVVPAGFLYRHVPWNEVGTVATQDPAQQFDQIYQFYPWARYFKESVWDGEFPLWDPFNYLGTPFFANPQTALLFPLTWLHLIVPLSLSFTLIYIAKLVLALVGMYLWLSNIGLKPLASLLGAAVFSLSMHTVAGIPFPYSTVEVLFPWLLLTTRLVCQGPCRRVSGIATPVASDGFAKRKRQAGSLSYLFFVATFSGVALAGQPQSVLPACLGAALLAVLTVRPIQARPLLLLGAGVLNALLLTSVQWLSTLDYLRESMVEFGPRIIKSGYPYTIDTLVSLVVPDFFGSPIHDNFWGFPGYNDSIFYSSIVGLLLAVGGVWLGRRRERVQFLLPMLLLFLGAGVMFALPIFENLLDLPGFELARRNKFVFLGIFAIAQLAAVGLDEIQREKEPRHSSVFGLAAVLFLAGGSFLFWKFAAFLEKLDPQGIATRNALICLLLLAAAVCLLLLAPNGWKAKALVALVLVDLSFFSSGLNPRGSAEQLYPEPEINQMLTGERPRIYGFQGAYTPNSALVFGLQDVRGYDVMTPTRLFRYMQRIDPSLGNAYTWLMSFDPDQIGPNTRMRRIIGEVLEDAEPEVIEYLKADSYWSVSAGRIDNPVLFDLLQIQYLFTAGKTAPPGFEPLWGTTSMQLFERTDTVRAKAYARWRTVEEGAALQEVADHTDAREVLVEVDLPEPSTGPEDSVEIRLLELTNGSSRYLVESSHPTVFVEFERFSPGWEATLNGQQQTNVFPAFSLFRGVYLPAGRNEVELSYCPTGFRYGLWISLIGLVLLAGLVGLGSRGPTPQ